MVYGYESQLEWKNALDHQVARFGNLSSPKTLRMLFRRESRRVARQREILAQVKG